MPRYRHLATTLAAFAIRLIDTPRLMPTRVSRFFRSLRAGILLFWFMYATRSDGSAKTLNMAGQGT